VASIVEQLVAFSPEKHLECAMLGTLLILLPMAVGGFVMWAAGAPPSRWVVHLAVGVVGALVFLALDRAGRLSARAASCLAIVALVVVAATFAGGAGIGGVQRWLALGAFRINPSALFTPALIIFAASRLRHAPWHAHATLLFMAVVHVAQPDAGQATACGIAAMVLTAGFDRRRWPLLAVYGFAIASAWLRPDPLEPAPFVEDIVARAFALSTLVGLVAIATALLAVLAPIAISRGLARPVAERATALALTSYFAVALLVPALGEFPVPLLGFGSSPALGAFLGIAALRRSCRAPRTIERAEGDQATPPNQGTQRAVAVLS
jgi:cell division protein FtsW (lipid II flippase)